MRYRDWIMLLPIATLCKKGSTANVSWCGWLQNNGVQASFSIPLSLRPHMAMCGVALRAPFRNASVVRHRVRFKARQSLDSGKEVRIRGKIQPWDDGLRSRSCCASCLGREQLRLSRHNPLPRRILKLRRPNLLRRKNPLRPRAIPRSRSGSTRSQGSITVPARIGMGPPSQVSTWNNLKHSKRAFVLPTIGLAS